MAKQEFKLNPHKDIIKEAYEQKNPSLKMQVEVTGEGVPIVLVPGGLAGWLSWEQHALRLAKTRKVVRVQLVSVEYGLSNRMLPSDYSLKTESKALEATLGEIGLAGPVDMVAWSYGAAITLDYALDHPDMVRTLTLIEPPAFWVLGGQKPSGKDYEALEELGRTLHNDVSEIQLEQFACAVGLCPPGRSPRELPQWPVWVQHRRSLLNTSAPFRHMDDIARLKTFEPPVLLLKGTGSARFLHHIIDALGEHLPHAQIVEMPAGHAPHIVSMDRFLEELASFQKIMQGVMRQRDDAKTVSMGSNVVTFHLNGDETGGRYSLTEFVLAAPPAPGPPMHIHEAESEATYVLEGEILLTLGERSIKASKGAILFVPRGIRHGLSNLGPGTTRILVILTPPGFEKFWEEMAGLLRVSGGKPDPATVLSLQEKYHMDAGGQVRKV